MEFIKNLKENLKENFKENLNRDKLIKITMWFIIILFIALLSSFNTVATIQENEEVVEENVEWYPWELNTEWNAQEMPALTSAESHQRFIELCEKYNLPADVIWFTENYYWLKEGTVLCVAIAETSWWKNGWGKEGCWNYGNVWNTDNPNNRRCFANQWAWLAAIWQTLNNDYLRNNQTIACLNWAWECLEPKASSKRYSTWTSWNRQRNMSACFYAIYQEKIDPKTFNLHQR